jgi:hypothetical protein
MVFGLALASCKSGEPPPPAPPPARPTPPSKPVAADPAASGSLGANLARNQEEAEASGWKKKEVVELGPDAAVAIYRKARKAAHAPREARADTVTAGHYAPQSFVNGIVDVARAPGGSFFWDLRGDKSTSIVLNLTPCSAHCGVPEPKVVELVSGRFVVPNTQPECPTCIGDRNRNGVPEFEVALLRLDVAPCSRVSCGPSLFLRAEVRGYEAWDGSKYARELSEFEPLCFERLKKTKAEVARAKRSQKKAKICPLSVLQTAAELFVYSRYIGESKGDALEQADDVMKGYSLERCRTEYELLGSPKSWAELRSELSQAALPELVRKR